MADKKPAGPPEVIVNAAAGCARRRPAPSRHLPRLLHCTAAAPRLRNATPPRRAPRVSKPLHHAGKDAASTAKALEKAFGTSDADGCWLLSLVASDGTAPWAMTHYGKVLDGLSSKKGPVKAAAKAAWAKVVPTLQPEAAPLEMKALYGAMAVEKQWPCRVAALERVAALCASAPKQTAACLPTLVPELTPSLWDTKKEVKAAAKAAVTAAFGLSGNRDVEPARHRRPCIS